jgi:hypothetical protein
MQEPLNPKVTLKLIPSALKSIPNWSKLYDVNEAPSKQSFVSGSFEAFAQRSIFFLFVSFIVQINWFFN